MSYQKLIEHLKNLTLTENEDFSISAKYFLSHLADDPLFCQQGKPLEKELDFYRELLNASAVKHFGNNVRLDSLLLLQLKDYQFIHGIGVLSNGKMLMLYFFEDVKMGMAVVSSFGSETNFFRLTIFVDEEKKLSEKTIVPTIISKAYN
jgi:hypothetical protein